MYGSTVVVIGANRGIGLAIVTSLLSSPSTNRIYATSRSPSSSPELTSLASSNPDRLKIVQCDFTSKSSLAGAVSTISTTSSSINTLLINAGQYGKTSKPSEIDTESALEILGVNVAGPIQTLQAFLPLLRASGATEEEAARVLFMSSDAGSIKQIREGGGMSGGTSYWMSKAALNMYGMSLSNELRPENIAVLCLHPGWIQTDMGGKNAPLTMDQAIPGIMKRIEELDMAHSGKFLNYKGDEVPF